MVNVANEAARKFKVLNAPIEHPGTCISCGSSRVDDRDYVDFDLFIEWTGAIYFCTFCFNEAANTLGYLSPEQTFTLENELNEARQAIINFRHKEKVLDGAVDSLRNSGILSITDDSSIEAILPLNEDATGDNSKSKSTDSKTKQSISKQGPDDISTVRSNDPFGDFL